jgi:hypothetical protein
LRLSLYLRLLTSRKSLVSRPFKAHLKTVFDVDVVRHEPATHLLQPIHLEVVGGRQQVLYLLRGIFDAVHVDPLNDVLEVYLGLT